MTSSTHDCARFQDELADWIEGDVSPEVVAHLAECDACRDLRHEATQIARRVARAGSDYVAPDPEALVARVLATVSGLRVSARTPPHGTQLPVVLACADTTEKDWHHERQGGVSPACADTPIGEGIAAEAAHGSPTRAGAMEAAVGETLEPRGKPRQQGPVEPPSSPGRVLPSRPSAAPWFVGIGVCFAVAAGAVGWLAVRSVAPRRGNGTSPTVAMAPWRPRVDRVLRASTDTLHGLQVQAPGAQSFVAAQEADLLPPGVRVRTDAKTRVRLSLDDGSVLVLDRATEVLFDASAPRTARLVAGNLVADVAHREGARAARLVTAAGPVEVLGTRFALSATEEHTNVRVTRGAVKVGEAPQTVTVKTGQEATLSRRDGVSIAPATDLATATAWADLGTDPSDMPIVGLGELRARRPGASQERDQALRLAAHHVKVRIAGNVARTEIEEVFQNDTDHPLEGIYRFPLPPEAQVETLALDVNGRMEPGTFVERERAAAIWRGVIRHATPRPPPTQEEFVWVPGPWRDPALLEWQRGGRFELRVFPIPAHGSRRVALSYTQTVMPSGGLRRYVHPLPHNPDGSTRVDRFSLDVQVLGHDQDRGVRASGYALTTVGRDASTGAERFQFVQQDFVPSGDLVVEYTLPDARSPLTAWTYQPPTAPGSVSEPGYVALALRPSLPRWADARPRDYVFAIDTSHSMVGERLVRAARIVSTALAEMDPRDRVLVLACDTRCRPLGAMEYASARRAQEVSGFFQSMEPLGASDLVTQVRDAVRTVQATALPGRDLRVVYVGDGAATVGWRRPEHIAAEIAAIVPRETTTVTAVAIGNDADMQSLAALARAGGGVVVPYMPGERVRSAALSMLEATYGVMLRDPEVILPPGLTAAAPAKVGSIRAGAEALVFARMSAPSVAGEVVLRGTVHGEPYEARYPVNLQMTQHEGNAFVPRLYAAARIADLDATGGAAARNEALALSQRFRVASRHSSLLVLESPAMFRAFGVERNTEGPQWTGETAAQGTVTHTASGTATNLSEEAADEAALEQRPSLDGDLAARGTGGGSERASRGAMAPAAPARVALPAGEAFDAATPSAGRLRATMRPPTGRWMHRIWIRRAELTQSTLEHDERAFGARVERAREALLTRPDSRDRHRELYRWLALSGSLDEAAELVSRWSRRDPLDPEAIARMADVVALQGERERSVRILSGMLDLRPDDLTLHERMATLHERANDPEAACAYRISAAELRPRDAAVTARALRCLRLLGRADAASRLLAAVPDATVRARAEAEAAAGLTELPGELRGELTVTASWEGGEDLDLAVIDPQGRRVSWQGGREGITARQATDPLREALGVARLGTGEHVIEVLRSRPGYAPLRVRLRVRALGQERTFTATLVGSHAHVARVTVLRESQLVPVDGPMPGSHF